MTDKTKKIKQAEISGVTEKKELKPFSFDDLAADMSVTANKLPPVVTVDGEKVGMKPVTDITLIPWFARRSEANNAGRINNGYVIPMISTCDVTNTEDWYVGHGGGVTIYATVGSIVDVKMGYNYYLGDEKPNKRLFVNASKIIVKQLDLNGTLALVNSLLDLQSLFIANEVILDNSTILNATKTAIIKASTISNSRISPSDRIWIVKSEVSNLSLGTLYGLDIENSTVSSKSAMWWGAGDHGKMDIKDQRYMIWEELPYCYPTSEPGIEMEVYHRTHYGMFTGLKPVPFVRLKGERILLSGGHVVSLKDLEDMIPPSGPFSTGNRFAGGLPKNELRDKLAEVFAGSDSQMDSRLVYDAYGESFGSFLRAIISRLKVFKAVAAVKMTN